MQKILENLTMKMSFSHLKPFWMSEVDQICVMKTPMVSYHLQRGVVVLPSAFLVY